MEHGITSKTLILLFLLLSGAISIYAQPCLPDGITFTTQSQIDSFPINYPGCTEIEGDVTIIPISEIVSLDSLYVLSSIGGELMINQCLSLHSLSGLHNLQNIGGSLTIVGNINLNSLHALSNLRTIGLVLTIFNNDRIKTLHGLDSLDPESIVALDISYNNSLSWCAVESVCQYIANPNASVGIQENTTDCNSVEVVEAFCQNVGIPEQQSATQLSTYPNPFTTTTTIEYELTEPTHVNLTIYNAIGETIQVAIDRLMPVGMHTFTWSPEGLPEGMYYAVLRSEKGVSVCRLIKL